MFYTFYLEIVFESYYYTYTYILIKTLFISIYFIFLINKHSTFLHYIPLKHTIPFHSYFIMFSLLLYLHFFNYRITIIFIKLKEIII